MTTILDGRVREAPRDASHIPARRQGAARRHFKLQIVDCRLAEAGIGS
jgi:hypothetical protein